MTNNNLAPRLLVSRHYVTAPARTPKVIWCPQEFILKTGSIDCSSTIRYRFSTTTSVMSTPSMSTDNSLCQCTHSHRQNLWSKNMDGFATELSLITSAELIPGPPQMAKMISPLGEIASLHSSRPTSVLICGFHSTESCWSWARGWVHLLVAEMSHLVVLRQGEGRWVGISF
jgi:hypothetical protein